MMGCSQVDTTPMFTLGNLTYTTGMFRYQLALLKTQYLSTYYKENLSTATEFVDIPSFWESKYDKTQTMGEYIYRYAIDSARATLYYANLASKQGITLSGDENKKIDQDMQDLIALKKSMKNLNAYLAKVGLDYDGLRELYVMQDLATKMQNSMYNLSVGSSRVTDDEMWKYYLENYAVVKHVYINTLTKVAETGKSVPLTEEEKKEKQALINQVVEGLKQGKDISDFAEISEDGFFENKPDSLVIYEDATGFTEYEQAALNLPIGKYTVLDVTAGKYIGTYIIHRYQNTEQSFNSKISATSQEEESFTYKEVTFVTLTQKKIADTVKKVKTMITNEELLAQYTVENTPLLD